MFDQASSHLDAGKAQREGGGAARAQPSGDGQAVAACKVDG